MSNRHLREDTSLHLTGPSSHPPKPASTTVCPVSAGATLHSQWLKTKILELSLTPPLSHTRHLVYQRAYWLYLWNISSLVPSHHLHSATQVLAIIIVHLNVNSCLLIDAPVSAPCVQHSLQSDFSNKCQVTLFYYQWYPPITQKISQIPNMTSWACISFLGLL